MGPNSTHLASRLNLEIHEVLQERYFYQQNVHKNITLALSIFVSQAFLVPSNLKALCIRDVVHVLSLIANKMLHTLYSNGSYVIYYYYYYIIIIIIISTFRNEGGSLHKQKVSMIFPISTPTVN